MSFAHASFAIDSFSAIDQKGDAGVGPGYTKETTYVQNLYTSISNGSITPTPVYSTGAINVYFADLLNSVSPTPANQTSSSMFNSKSALTKPGISTPPVSTPPPQPLPSSASGASNNTTPNTQPPLPTGFGQ